MIGSERDLDTETHIYRFVDFFALIDTVRNRRLRFSAARTFPDKNEGLEIHFNSLRAASISKDGSYQGFTGPEQARNVHNTLKNGTFVCSWAHAADSIALWSLYSADKCGVRISTTVSKLEQVVTRFAQQNNMQSQFNRFGLQDHVSYVYVHAAAVTNVCYKNLRDMHENLLKNGRSEPNRDSKEEKDTFAPFTLKDKAFIHESEIRGIIMCGLAESSQSTGSFAHSAPWLVDDYLYVEIPGDFVESVAIDPRCPKHRRAIIEGYLQDQKISIAESNAFGYLPDALEFIAPKIK